jgi:hypothetical protein
VSPLGCGASVEDGDHTSATSSGTGAGASGAGTTSTGTMPGGPLHLESAKLVSGTDVLLVFSEAVAPTGHVDPHDFRMSTMLESKPGALYYCSYGSLAACDAPFGNSCYPATADECASGGCCPQKPDGQTFYYSVGEFDELIAGDHPNELVARLTWGVLAGACSGLFLHYAPSATPIASPDGAELAPIGNQQWVEHPNHPAPVDGHRPDSPMSVNIDVLATGCETKKFCKDGVADEFETDVDCGGDCHTKCNVGKHCFQDGDCDTNLCVNKVCVVK